MTQWMTFLLVVVATTTAMVEARAIPAEPISVMLDPYGNPIVFLREKRTPVHPYPHRAMMFTSYYRPVRRSNSGGQATGVFAQGNAVSGEAFFGGMQAPHLKDGPAPIQEPEVSSAEAEASPTSDESFNEEGHTQVQEDDGYQPEEPLRHPEHHHHQEHHHQQEEHHHHQQEHHQPEDHHHHHHQDDEGHHQDDLPSQEQPEPPQPAEEPAAVPTEEPVSSNTEAPTNRPKVHHAKKSKKPPVVIDEEDEEDYDEDDDDDSDMPFVPFKGNRRRQNYPNLNNFFPMIFRFPGVSTRAGGSSGSSPPGTITAIANSYSTGKSGVASSIATAYGGSPNGKKRRTPVSED